MSFNHHLTDIQNIHRTNRVRAVYKFAFMVVLIIERNGFTAH